MCVPFTPQKPSLFGETLDTLSATLKEAGHPHFRAKQIMEWLYKQRVETFEAMSNLPKSLREWLAQEFCIYPVQPLLDKR